MLSMHGCGHGADYGSGSTGLSSAARLASLRNCRSAEGREVGKSHTLDGTGQTPRLTEGTRAGEEGGETPTVFGSATLQRPPDGERGRQRRIHLRGTGGYLGGDLGLGEAQKQPDVGLAPSRVLSPRNGPIGGVLSDSTGLQRLPLT